MNGRVFKTRTDTKFYLQNLISNIQNLVLYRVWIMSETDHDRLGLQKMMTATS